VAVTVSDVVDFGLETVVIASCLGPDVVVCVGCSLGDVAYGVGARKRRGNGLGWSLLVFHFAV